MEKKFLFLYCLCLIIGVSELCANNSEYKGTSFRSFDQEKIDEYNEDCNYYLLEAAPTGMWDNFIEWLTTKLESIFTNVPSKNISSILSIAIRGILWGLGIFAVVMILITLFKHGVFNVVKKEDKSIDIMHQNLEEQVLETNWQNLIDVEIKACRYNVALRLLFLQTIQQLNEKQLINWEKNKTNFDYLRELRKTEFDHSFSNLMRYYNFGWFGDFDINELAFIKMHTEFKTFNTSIA